MGFSAEMRDFLAAYKTGQSINASRTDQDYKEVKTAAEKAKMEHDNDPETLDIAKKQAQATLDATRANMGNAAARTAIAGRTADAQISASKSLEDLRRAQADIYRNAGQPQNNGTGLLPGAPGAIAGSTLQPTAPVLPVAPSTINTDEEAYAAGGLVDDDEEAEGPQPASEETVEGAIPMDDEASTSAATDFSAQSRQPRGINGVISPQLVEDARKAGLTWGIEKAGLTQSGAVKSPAAMLKAKQIAQGMGGLSEQEMQAAKQAVDPQGKLTDSQRNLAALGSVYQFWANKGEPEKAQRVAFQMLQYYRNASQRYAAIAAKAAEGGNMDLATKAALKAYANVPDSKDLEIVPNPDGGLMYTYTDANGDVIAKGIATPQQLAASAMGLATGGFDKALMTAAGAMPAKGAVDTKGGGKPQSASDRSKESENIGGEIEKLKADWVKKNPNQPANEEEWSEIGNVAQHIYQQNPKATANEVTRAAYAMLIPTGDPEKAPFKVKPGEEGAPSTIDFGGKLKVKIDDEQLDSILNSRAARVKTAVDKINSDMEESEKPGFADKAIEAGKTIAGGVSKLPTIPEAAASGVRGAYSLLGKMLPDVPVNLLKEAVPTELVERVGSDISKIRSLVGGKLNNPAQNPGAIPVDEGDRPL